MEQFAAYPDIKNCMTKQMLHQYCAARINISQTMLEEALRRVNRMAFVGLTDAYNASVCLLYHMFEGEMKEWMFATHARKAEDIAAKEGLEMKERNGGFRVSRDYWFAASCVLQIR